MKVNRDDILWFLKNIRRKYPDADDTQLADHLASYMEANPRCVNIEGVSHPGRFAYSTVGYGVFSLLGEKYTMGRIEVFDSQDESGYAVHEGIYTMPHMAASQFQDFMDSLETDLPINIEIGSHKWCEQECAVSLGFKDVEEMRDPEKVKEYRHKKNDEFAKEQGYKDWDDLLANSKWLKEKK